MTHQNSGWNNNSDNETQGGTDLEYSPNDSEDEASSRSAFRVDRTNHDKKLCRPGAIQFRPKKGSSKLPRANSQKSLPIY
jgi:hypothetical protein